MVKAEDLLLKKSKLEAYKYTYEWEPNMSKAVEIVEKILKNPDANPNGVALKDLKSDTYPSTGGFIVRYKDEDGLDFSAPSAKKILDKYQAYKTYDVMYRDFKDQRYFSITVKTKEWYDPEFGPGFDRDEYMANRRAGEWARAQRDTHN